MWSKPLLRRFRQSKKTPQTQASQGFAAFHLTLSRIPPRHSQSRRATNCATPGYSVFYPAGRILPNVAPYQLSHTRIFNFCHYTTSKKIIKVFSVRARSYGQTRFCAALSSQPKSRKRRRRKAFRRFVLPSSGYCRGALKRSSLDRSAPDSENTPPACGRRIYYTSFFSGLQGKNGSPAHSPRAAFSASTRSVFSQATPRSSRPMWP